MASWTSETIDPVASEHFIAVDCKIEVRLAEERETSPEVLDPSNVLHYVHDLISLGLQGRSARRHKS